MQDNPNITDDTGSNTPFFEMDREDWEIAFEAFKGTGHTAILMGQNIRMIYKYLDSQLFKPRPVMEALDLADQFKQVRRECFRFQVAKH